MFNHSMILSGILLRFTKKCFFFQMYLVVVLQIYRWAWQKPKLAVAYRVIDIFAQFTRALMSCGMEGWFSHKIMLSYRPYEFLYVRLRKYIALRSMRTFFGRFGPLGVRICKKCCPFVSVTVRVYVCVCVRVCVCVCPIRRPSTLNKSVCAPKLPADSYQVLYVRSFGL